MSHVDYGKDRFCFCDTLRDAGAKNAKCGPCLIRENNDLRDQLHACLAQMSAVREGLELGPEDCKGWSFSEIVMATIRKREAGARLPETTSTADLAPLGPRHR